MPSSITINSITGTSPYNITLCDNDPSNQTCVWVAQITDLDLPYTFTPPLVLQYTTNYLVKIADSSFGSCVIIVPPVLRTLNPCYPIYIDASNNKVYSFDPSTYLTSLYFDPLVQIDAITKNDDKIYIFDSSQGWIYEYNSTASTNPSFIRQIDTTYNSIDIYGMCTFSSSTELLVLSSTGDVNIIDISSNIATITNNLYNIGGTPQNDCNLLRDDNIGITYLKTSLTGLKAFYDDGTQYSTGSWPAGYLKGLFRDSTTAEIYGVGDTGSVYQIQQPPGSINPVYVTGITPDNLVSGGLGQSSTCIPNLISSKIYFNSVYTGTCISTIVLTSSTFSWINWGDSIYVSGGTGAYSKTHTYSPSFTGEVSLNTYQSITGIFIPTPAPANATSITYYTSEMSKLSGLTLYQTGINGISTNGFIGNIPNSMIRYEAAFSALSGYTYDFPQNLLYFATNNYYGGNLKGNVSYLPPNLQVLYIGGGQNLSGSTSGLPTNLVWLRLDNSDTISDSTYGLPSQLKYLNIYYSSQNTISGSTSGLPSTLSHCWINGNNTISGDTSGLPRIDYSVVPENNNSSVSPSLVIGGNNTISGNASGLPPKSQLLIINGYNTISGDTSGLPITATTIEIGGNNTISGDTSGLPITANTRIYGFNIISGDVGNLPKPSVVLVDAFTEPGIAIRGNNTISGNIGGLSGNSSLKYFNISQRTSDYTGNTISGSISQLSGLTSLRDFTVEGANTISGDVKYLPPQIRKFRLKGFNTLSGDVKDIPSTMTDFFVYGNNTIGGNISGLKPMSFFDLRGNNVISGGFSGFTAQTTYFTLSGGNIDISSGSTNGMVFPNNMCVFQYLPVGSGLSQYDVDNILVSATGATWTPNISCTFGKYIDLRGANSAPGPTGLAAKAKLTGSPYFLTVYTN